VITTRDRDVLGNPAAVGREEIMTKAEIDHFRRQLLAMKSRLGGELSQLEDEALRPVGGEASGNLSDVPVHPADLATENYDVEGALDLLEGETQLLKEVDDALARIGNGTFGRCEICHQEIPRERLEAVPYTRYCIKHAKELEGGSGE
jgi:DnaK suppressor protein